VGMYESNLTKCHLRIRSQEKKESNEIFKYNLHKNSVLKILLNDLKNEWSEYNSSKLPDALRNQIYFTKCHALLI
jgi:hypothetical protein